MKEDLRIYQGDLCGGTCLVVIDDWSYAVLCVPTPGKGRVHLKFMAEQVMRVNGNLGFFDEDVVGGIATSKTEIGLLHEH